jgi:hypothetical protein
VRELNLGVNRKKPLAAALRDAVVVMLGVFAFVGTAVSGTRFADLSGEAPELDPAVLRLALAAVDCAESKGFDGRHILTVIDYSLPSTVPRLWVFDLLEHQLLFRELVAHGKNTGANLATEFSNREGSKQSSLGLFLTAETYHGRNGYSLKLVGLEEGVNHLARQRAIVLHGAWYVSQNFANTHGRLGRSWGCPAVPTEVARPLIDTIKDGTYMFIYYPDEEWLETSAFLHDCGDDPVFTSTDPTERGSASSDAEVQR